MTRGTWVKLACFILFVAGLVWALKALGVDLRTLTPETVRRGMLSFGVWAPAVYLAAYGQPLVPLPASVMTVAAGLAFGPLWGTLAALTGMMIRACSEFLLARLLGREAVAKLLKGKVAALDEKIGENGFKTVLLIRLIPNVPFDLQNYGLGFSKVAFLPYALASFLGMIPGCLVFIYMGYSLTDPKQIWKPLLMLLLLAGLVLATKTRKAGHRPASVSGSHP